MSEVLPAIVSEMIENDRFQRTFTTSFSMGGNLTLKMTGELEEGAPRALLSVCAVNSPAGPKRNEQENQASS